MWINPNSWDSTHWLDSERFYKFLKALKRYSRKPRIDGFQKKIIKAVKDKHPQLPEDYLVEKSEYFLGIAEHFFAYERAPFPDPWVEMSNPHAVSLYLGSVRKLKKNGKFTAMYSQEEIKQILDENFGKGWETRYLRQVE